MQTYAQPIFRFRKTLEQFDNVTSNKTSFREWTEEIRDQTHFSIMPFHEYFGPDSDEKVGKREKFDLTYSRYRYQHTRLLQPDQDINLGAEESLLRWAVEESQGTICTVLVEISLAIESFWQSTFNHPLKPTSYHATLQGLKPKVLHWQSGLEELIAWLGWVGEYTGCDEKCAWDETCFIPMWPLIPRTGNRPRFNGSFPGYWFQPNRTFTSPPSGFGIPWADSEGDLWTPKCTKKEFFLTGKRG